MGVFFQLQPSGILSASDIIFASLWICRIEHTPFT
jgi:hypothetical protein